MKNDIDFLNDKKWWKKFNKLSQEDKKKILEVLISTAINNAMRKATTDAMVAGILFQKESLYNRYAEKIDRQGLTTEERKQEIDKLLGEIRMGHLDYVKMMREKEGQKDGN